MMFEPYEAMRTLSRLGRQRLQDIARAEKALPWEPRDEELAELRLVSEFEGPLGEQLASISDNGWSVLRLLACR